MEILVAGEKKEVKDGISLNELMIQENVETPQYVTVSINGEFVPSDEKDTTVLKQNDEVEFLYFMGGGSLKMIVNI
ncbi:MAG: sulfur carrier protein ThiS [Succinivibrionaceae bacterium]